MINYCAWIRVNSNLVAVILNLINSFPVVIEMLVDLSRKRFWYVTGLNNSSPLRERNYFIYQSIDHWSLAKEVEEAEFCSSTQLHLPFD